MERFPSLNMNSARIPGEMADGVRVCLVRFRKEQIFQANSVISLKVQPRIQRLSERNRRLVQSQELSEPAQAGACCNVLGTLFMVVNNIRVGCDNAEHYCPQMWVAKHCSTCSQQ